jgi:transposase InsO family protein
MSYTTNPNIPKVRARAVALVCRGLSTRQVARHLGFNQSTIVRWVAKSNDYGSQDIPTESSRPKVSPRALPRGIVQAIVKERVSRRRCAEHVHRALLKQGIKVSLSSVKRTLDRCHLTKKRSPWKRPHDATIRPEVTHVGALIQIDTVHIMAPDGSKIYVYTLIDLYSRWAYAEVVERIGANLSVLFIDKARKKASFNFEMIQSDHGSEFSIWFTHALLRRGIKHRHSRVRQSNDNAHVERFNRTLQEECLDRTRHTVEDFKKALSTYLKYYNTERTHMGINYQTPLEVMQRY